MTMVEETEVVEKVGQKEVLDILIAALAAFEGGKRWCRRTLFMTANGPAGLRDTPRDEILAFCATGALYYVMEDRDPLDPPYDSLYGTLCESGWTESLPTWNDTPGRTFAEVEELFDRTIIRLQATS